MNEIEFSTSIIYKTFVEKFVTIISLLKESMILLNKAKCNFTKTKIIKINTIYILKLTKIIMGAGRGIGPQSQ